MQDLENLILKADQNDPKAQYSLGIMYKYGYGIEQDFQKAKKYYTLSCKNGLQEECNGYQILEEVLKVLIDD